MAGAKIISLVGSKSGAYNPVHIFLKLNNYFNIFLI